MDGQKVLVSGVTGKIGFPIARELAADKEVWGVARMRGPGEPQRVQEAGITALPLDMRGAPFELRVWDALRTIPPGTTTTYGAIARTLRSPDASRAVGMANGANPIAIIVPCHRVIGANGTLTGYGGGLDKKTWLLEHEKRWSKDRRLF